ncbi:FtsB family cell division protein [Sinomonas terrae]|uniref:Septum formation initiator family protein n=1 Tax=Sinomonas terrae TaxID=2908838 RepID=A0ABS9U3H1_9MICC|nr:septum formation initiator family protein [Sinomonas terrae]MCH6471238.1 septum formation initiator family protein [Sinomonas terrae]
MATRRPQVPRSVRAAGASTASPASAAKGDAHHEATHRAAGERPSSSAAARATSTATRTRAASTARTSAPGRGSSPKLSAAQRSAARDQQPVPARAFSGRILALALVLVAVTIMLAPTIRVFFSQRAEIHSIQADIASKQTDQTNLKDEISRWQDPAYVQQQARDRINMVMPGETSYWVFGDVGASSTSSSATSNATSGSSPSDVPWTQSLWDAVRRAATQ